jgi:diguanylate cyclase (GGDEF)-like protein/PAS domain S-box-containing protein
MAVRRRLVRKYVFTLVTLVGAALAVSALVETFFDVQSQREALTALQREKSLLAAQKIETFIVDDVERHLEWAFPPPYLNRITTSEERRVELAKLMAQVPALAEVSYVDIDGQERVRVSRTAVTVVDSMRDRSGELAFVEGRRTGRHFGTVYLRNGSEPYMTIAAGRADAGALVAEVNLTFILEVIAAIKVGSNGYAYIVDDRGRLIAHPDAALMLRNTDASGLPQVRAARDSAGSSAPAVPVIGRDFVGNDVLSGHADITSARWVVFVDEPVGEAYAPLYNTLLRSAVLLLFGFIAALAASVALARNLVTPILALQAGAERVAAGMLDHRIDVRTGDELEALADEFNRMTGQLRSVYGSLEQKVEERTGDLVTEHRRVEDLLREKGDLYDPLLQAQSDLGEVIVITEGEEIVYMNAALGSILGHDAGAIRDLTALSEVIAPEDRAAFRERLRSAASGAKFETALVRRDGDRVELEVAIEQYHTGDRERRVVVARDITERNEARRALEHQALHDTLTQLPNRTLLDDRLDQGIRHARREDSHLMLLLIDLDHFKEVNDAFGHHAGDELLGQIGPRLRGVLRETDTVARLGGDEFAIIVPTTDLAEGPRVAERVLRAITPPFTVEGRAVDVSASIGISFYPEHGEDAGALLRCADVAMYVAKGASSGYQVYAAQHDQHTADRLALTADLRRAVELDEFVVHYQPLATLASSRVLAVEALVRWQHPTRGLIQPLAFIGLAEQTGLIKPLTALVLRAAARQCREWHDHGLDLVVAVNLSARSLLDSKLPAVVAEILAKAGVKPEWLSFELTESVLMVDPERARDTLIRLREMGIKLSIDDFGTGYSSLAYLRHLPVDEVKIDRSFVSTMTADRSSAAIVRSTIELGHNLGFRVVAEGVEDGQVYEQLAQLGCDTAQGFGIARPMPAADFETWLAASAWSAAPRVAALGAATAR